MKLTKSTFNPILSPNPTNHWRIWLYAILVSGMRTVGSICYTEQRVMIKNTLFVSVWLSVRMAFILSVCLMSRHLVLLVDGEDAGCVEDARVVKFDDYYYVTYAFRPCAPGQYWKFAHDEVIVRDFGENAPYFLKRNMANTALAMTKDFKKWIRLGRITQSNLDDRDVILFPEKINGKYAMLHRPKEWIGPQYGPKHPAIWLRYSDDLLVWNEPSHLLIEGIDGGWEEKIGGSTPPLKTDKGWLVLYHGVENGGCGYYRVGAMMLDLNDPTKVLGRTKDWILEPEFSYEIDGFYKGCVFPTGNVIVGDTLYVYYGGADKYVGVATANVDELVTFILTQKV